MPTIRQNELMIQDANLRKAIKGAAGYFCLTSTEQAAIAGVTRATWYRRVNEPSNFSIRELRRMIHKYGWDSDTVCRFLGVREGS